MRAMLCGCRRRVEARDEEKLIDEVLGHLTREHPGPGAGQEWVRQAVKAHSYRIEYPDACADDAASEEAFGPEPY